MTIDKRILGMTTCVVCMLLLLGSFISSCSAEVDNGKSKKQHKEEPARITVEQERAPENSAARGVDYQDSAFKVIKVPKVGNYFYLMDEHVKGYKLVGTLDNSGYTHFSLIFERVNR